MYRAEFSTCQSSNSRSLPAVRYLPLKGRLWHGFQASVALKSIHVSLLTMFKFLNSVTNLPVLDRMCRWRSWGTQTGWSFVRLINFLMLWKSYVLCRLKPSPNCDTLCSENAENCWSLQAYGDLFEGSQNFIRLVNLSRLAVIWSILRSNLSACCIGVENWSRVVFLCPARFMNPFKAMMSLLNPSSGH